jgi:mono/diheme cytochrome c family protein
MSRLCLASVLLLLTTAASAQTPAEQGKAVYAAQKCGVCHAIAGVGNKRGTLDAVGTKLSADLIRQWIVTPAEMTAKTKAERKPLMRAYPNLPKADVDALVAYLSALKGS